MTYIVQVGDTIQSIADRFNVNVNDLIKENDLKNIYYLVPGLELIIPTTSKDSAFEYYTVQKGDNLYQIGKKYNLSAELLANINGLELNEYIFPDQKLLVPKEGVFVYITKEGDTLNLVSDELGIPRESILLYNDNIYLLPEQLIAYRIRNNM